MKKKRNGISHLPADRQGERRRRCGVYHTFKHSLIHQNSKMKTFLVIFLFFFCINSSYAQDTTLMLSPGMFNGSEEIFISTMDGWLFREGHEPGWANKEINLSGWRKLKPAELSAKLADKNGKLEGWLRLKVNMDTTFGNMPLGLRFYCWAASELYIDGNLIQSFGNTGADGKPFKEFNPNNKLPVRVTLVPGKEHIIAIHFVDEVVLYSGKLKSEDLGLSLFVRLTGPRFYSFFSKYISNWPRYSSIWMSVCMLLSVLFWLLTFQNPREKNLRLIAQYTTIFAFSVCILTLREDTSNSFGYYKIYNSLYFLCNYLLLGIIPMIISQVFKHSVPQKLRILLVVYTVLGILNAIVGIGSQSVGIALGVAISLFLCIYYLISSWKKLRGAQWVIVPGLLLTLFFLLGFVALTVYNRSQNIPGIYLFLTGFYLSFPLSLMAYVSLRFTEILSEVRENANQVMQLNEEKKDQAVHQQKILEVEVARQTAELRTTLENLKSTQSQLIQSEKMASLGELTAGIAHEIQNPLNFVNNFSEVNKELLLEMKDEIDKGNLEEVKAIANDVIGNEEKINRHGKRADAIVKGMLQHSRSGSGVKEPTDINALADEYLRLAYHGLRAKDKSFNATMVTDFDPSIGKANVMLQDIGRVILNLITNAFYAVNDKKKKGIEGYEPTVTVSTKKQGNKVMISVKDNGMGIPEKVREKIFQPFFTTKPTGEGTGLGLSMSYDIVTKGHGGELLVNSEEGSYAEFNIVLPA